MAKDDRGHDDYTMPSCSSFNLLGEVKSEEKQCSKLDFFFN